VRENLGNLLHFTITCVQPTTAGRRAARGIKLSHDGTVTGSPVSLKGNGILQGR